MRQLFDDKANFGIDYSHLQAITNYIMKIEVIPLKIEDEDYEHYPAVPNAYGVYFKYSDWAIDKLNLNPSEWIADFNTLDTANAFKSLIYALLTGHMKESERKELSYYLPAGWGQTEDRVS